MKLKKFRIHHYKSIIDSGECFLASDFTTLIGKNEAGKTALLEALRDFDRAQASIAAEAFPLSRGTHEKPSLEMTFEVMDDEFAAILEQSQLKTNPSILKNIFKNEICLTKSFSGDYRIKNEQIDQLLNQPKNNPQNEFHQIKQKKQRMEKLLDGIAVPEIAFGNDAEALRKSIESLRGLVRSRLNFIPEEAKKMEVIELLHDMARTANNLTNPKPAPILTDKDKLTHAVVQRLPRFIFFSDFNDILPFEISINDLKTNHAVEDFERIANLDLESAMKSDDLQERINILNRSSATISGDFLGDWEQNKIEIIARPEGNKILFGIKESAKPDFFKINQRSKGFQWFLSFYLRMNRYKNDTVVILIDEPGTNLHPIAQKDILKVLIRSSSKTQIIFSTHSSVLIDPARLDRLRFITKDNETGSTVKENIHSGVDQESLMPVVAAFGAQLPVNLPQQENVQAAQQTLIEATKPLESQTPAKIEEPLNPENIEEEPQEETDGSSKKPKRSIFGLFKKKNKFPKDKELTKTY